MKTKTVMVRNKIFNAMLFTTAFGIALGALAPNGKLVPAQQSANAAVQPKVIEITARKYDFSPSQITLKKGEPVILRLVSADRVHGFMSRPLKIDTDITPGKATDVAIMPGTAGNFTVICDHYCGTGHGNMKNEGRGRQLRRRKTVGVEVVRSYVC
jgi:cytochrome c oxidase subunit II